MLFCFVHSITAHNTNPNYDAELAKKLGAGDYGMKRFVLVMLKTGSNESTDKILRDSVCETAMMILDDVEVE